MSTRLTHKEEQAIRAALGFVLAGDPEENEANFGDLVEAMSSAWQKLSERDSART